MEFIQYFADVFTPVNLLILIFGTIGGLLLGATPGLSPTMAVALLIPFTFQMEPASSLILLGAVYTSTVAGGAVSGILVNIPGAPANIATIMDGHPMANQGRATEALHYCFISSLVGGLIGVVLLIFFTPMLAELALRFGPAELFWISIFGITIIASLGGGSILKGLIAGAVGLWLSTIGYNPVLGEERFVFSEHLAGGIHVIAALIGLFAIPQVLTLVASSGTSSGKASYAELRAHSVWKSFAYNLRRIKALTIGTVTGSIVGVIPGAGGQIAGLVAYDQTKKMSKDPSKFGKGEPDGVIAAESANNAMVGPSLVPLLTLGIPGSPTAAVLLGGLLIGWLSDPEGLDAIRPLFFDLFKGVLALFLLLITRIMVIGAMAHRKGRAFSGYVAYGIGLWLGLQAIVNVGVNLGVLPTKGLTLPLMSYGGSSLIICCMAIGLLLRIHYECGVYHKQAVSHKKRKHTVKSRTRKRRAR